MDGAGAAGLAESVGAPWREAPWRAAWLTWFRAMQRWHRFETRGFEHLERPGARLIVGYHGRGIAHDLCMLTALVHDRLGYLPHGIVHAAASQLPLGRSVVGQLGFVTGDDAALRDAVARGEHIIAAPGGTREACRPLWVRDRVDWGGRLGFLRLAARLGLDVLPVGAAGVDLTYLGLNDGYRTGKRVGVPLRLPLWFGVGLGGLFPFAPPFPVRIRQVIGAPISTRGIDPDDDAALSALGEDITRRIQSLIEEAKAWT